LRVSEINVDGRASDKRRRILQAAWFLLLRLGLRGMTMEALAREAGVAKATLYGQFPDKDAVAVAVIDDLLVDLRAAYQAGMAGEGGVAERIGAALAGKYGIIARALEGSPHADELLNEHYRFAERFAAFDMSMVDAIAAELAQAGVVDSARLTRTIIAAAHGIAGQISGPVEIDGAIRLMCRRMIEPEVRG
jgi:AcrR family transcriptional regulator